MTFDTAPSTATSPVILKKLDLSFRGTWKSWQRDALKSLARRLMKFRVYDNLRVIYTGNINSGLTEWYLGGPIDGYIVVQVRGRGWRKECRTVLRLTGSVMSDGSEPSDIYCLFYSTSTEAEMMVAEMLMKLGSELDVMPYLTLIAGWRAEQDDWQPLRNLK